MDFVDFSSRLSCAPLAGLTSRPTSVSLVPSFSILVPSFSILVSSNKGGAGVGDSLTSKDASIKVFSSSTFKQDFLTGLLDSAAHLLAISKWLRAILHPLTESPKSRESLQGRMLTYLDYGALLVDSLQWRMLIYLVYGALRKDLGPDL